MKVLRFLYIVMICLAIVSSAKAQDDAIQRLEELFVKAEKCYLMDDYQQLQSIIEQYAEIYDDNEEYVSADSTYMGLLYKMCGAYCYGMAGEDNLYASKAEQFYRHSLNIFAQKEKTEYIIPLHEELAQLYYKVKSYQEARNHLDSVYQHYEDRLYAGIEKYVINGVVYSVEAKCNQVLSQIAMCNARIGLYAEALRQIDEVLRYYSKEKSEDFYEALRKKGKILMIQADTQGMEDYDEAYKCYNQYVNERYTSLGKTMAAMDSLQRAQYWLATHRFLYDCYRMGNHAPRMLYNLALFSKGYLISYEHNRATPNTKWEQVQKELTPQDCAIEFVQYFGRDDEKRMGCLVLHHNTEPEFIDLFATDSLLAISIPYSTIGDAIGSSEDDINELYGYEDLPAIIWTPKLMTAIGDAKRVFFAPDGLLHQLAIEYIMPDTTKVCYRMSSTRNIKKKRSLPKLSKALLCGGFNYETTVRPVVKNNDILAYRFLSSNVSNIKDLKGSKEEVGSIYACRNNPQDMLLMENLATDEYFVKLIRGDYSLVHLATHGYYGGKIGIGGDLRPLTGDESMSRSGILFAGVSKNISDTFFDETMNDGILSAKELSQLDFSKTELVVLSACETGLGRQTDDGIFGIERGLKQAGANAIILSLWSVDDDATNLLMGYFYKNLEKQKEKDIHAAFMDARKQLASEEHTVYGFDPFSLTLKGKTFRYDAPRFIDPFILIDAY